MTFFYYSFKISIFKAFSLKFLNQTDLVFSKYIITVNLQGEDMKMESKI